MSVRTARPVRVEQPAAPAVQVDRPRLPLRLPLRLVRRGAVVVVLAAAGDAALEVVSYERTYPDAASRSALLRLTDDPVVRTVQGVPGAVDTVGGFVVWDAGWLLGLVLAVWALMTTTRLARGEEDSGRAELVLAGRVRPQDVLVAQLVVVACALLLAGAAVAATLVALGLPASGSLLFGAALTTTALVTGGLGALLAQLLPVRRRAVAAGAAVLALAYGLRMVASGDPDREWLLWLTPLGWPDQLRPYSGDRWGPLALPVLASLALAALAVRERVVRDTGAARLSGPDRRRPRLRLLGGAAAFGWRSGSGSLVGWCLGAAAYGALVGALVPSVVELLEEEGGYRDALEQFGFDLADPVDSFLAAMAGTLALVFALQAVWRVGALRVEEAAGRLELLLVRRLARSRWLATSALSAVVAAVLVVLASAAGVWAGSVAVGAGLSAAQAFGPLLAVLPVPVLFVGVAVLVLGAAPRLTVPLPAALALLTFLLYLLGESLGLPAAAVDLSPYSWLPRPPAQAFSPGAAVATTAVGVVAATVGTALFARRDLRPD